MGHLQVSASEHAGLDVYAALSSSQSLIILRQLSSAPGFSMVLPHPWGVHAGVKQSADTNGQYSPLHRTPLRVTALTAMILYCHTGLRRQRGAQPAKPTEDSTVGNKDCWSGSWREKLCFHCYSSTEHVSVVPTPLPNRGFSKGGCLACCVHTADIS